MQWIATATEAYNRNKYHETLAKTAAAKISLIDALIGHSGAELAVSRADEGPRRVALAACVVRAASGSAPRTMGKQHAVQHAHQLFDDAGLAPVGALVLHVRVWPMR